MKNLLKWNKKNFFYFEKDSSFDQTKLTSLEVSDITFIKSMKKKKNTNAPENCKKSGSCKRRKTSESSGLHQGFEIKNINNGENSENSSFHQNFEKGNWKLWSSLNLWKKKYNATEISDNCNSHKTLKRKTTKNSDSCKSSGNKSIKNSDPHKDSEKKNANVTENSEKIGPHKSYQRKN